jgi:hypothetical protein
MNIDKDAFSSGQIASKIWLCEQLENLFDNIDLIWIYGGWIGMTAFLLKSRNNIKISNIRSYDIDPTCESIADMINENWVIDNWKFKAVTQDCNSLNLDYNRPDLVINTSTEHFETREWWENIPKGTAVVLQGNDMLHNDHYINSASLDEFCNLYPMNELLYRGELKFQYPDWKFTRFMQIGIK